MTQLLALEWDVREARMAVGHTRGRELVLDKTFAIPLGVRGEESLTSSAVGEKIAEALRQHGIDRAEALVAVGRANIELKQFAVPGAPDDELPEIVRFQSLRQFTSLGDDWPLDYVKLGVAEAALGDGETINVLAATMSPDLVRQIRETCNSAGLTTKRLILRPFAAASLVRRQDRDPNRRCRLMVDLLTDEADLTVLDDQLLLLTRTVRLHAGEGNEPQARALMGEIRRTIAAASNQLGGREVEMVVLCGDGADHATLKALIEQELSLPAELFDPFAEMQFAGERPQHPGRFAPLLGMLRDEAAAVPHAIDFLHPRKKPESVNTRRRYITIAATLVSAAVVAALLVWFRLSSLDEEIELTRTQAGAMKVAVIKAEKTTKEQMAVQQFLDHNINWLDEMAFLSQRLLPPEELVLTQLNLSTQQPNGAAVRIEGFGTDATKFKEMEERLRVDGRAVAAGQKSNDTKRDKYQSGFVRTIKIPPVNGDPDSKKKTASESMGASKTSRKLPTSAPKGGDL